MTDSNTVLFVGTDAARTGAPVFLLRLLRWLQHNSELQFACLLERGGEMLSEFQETCRTEVLRLSLQDCGLAWRACGKFSPAFNRPQMRRDEVIRQWVRNQNSQIHYVNSVSAFRVVRFLEFNPKPQILHAHELESSIQLHCGNSILSWLRKRSQHTLVPAEVVRSNLCQQHDFNESTVDVVRGFLARDRDEQLSKDIERERLCKLLRRHPSTIVGMVGTMSFGKGFDLFLDVAREVTRLHKDRIHFVWIGAPTAELSLKRARKQVNRVGLDAAVTLIGPQPNAARLVAGLDLLTLTSREDCFPLVVLEAAAAEVPTICFEGCGGTPEFTAGAGIAVPYLDTAAMAAAVSSLTDNNDRRKRIARTARDKVFRECIDDVCAAQILNLINSVAGTNRSEPAQRDQPA